MALRPNRAWSADLMPSNRQKAAVVRPPWARNDESPAGRGGDGLWAVTLS